MPSPFPGMDPYLEGSLWTTVHGQLIAEIARQLTPRLPPRYLAFMTERFVVEMREDEAIGRSSIYPDVGVAEAGRGASNGGGVALATAPLRLTTMMPEAVPHPAVEIRDLAQRRLVTDIELLSPTNKRSEGYVEYLARRRQLLLSPAHLVEIDLLHEGRRVPMRDPLPPVPYFVLVSREELRPLVDVWPIRLQDPLPVVKIPLLAGDADVELDLQAAFSTIYDLLRYARAVNYAQPPEVRLPPDEAAFVDERLRAAGLRT
jgi:hypothetical protein